MTGVRSVEVLFHSACDCCGKPTTDPDEMLCEACWPERRKIEKRLAAIEAVRYANYWKARTGTSMHGYKPLPGAIYAEMSALRERLQELRP